MSKKRLDEEKRLVFNVQSVLNGIRNKAVYVYKKSFNDLYYKRFIEICSDATVIVDIDHVIDNTENLVYIISAENLNTFLQELKHLWCLEEEYFYLKSIRYSENEWHIKFRNMDLYILERQLCSLIRRKLEKKIASNMTLAFHIVDHCNLNCQMCNKYAPLTTPNFFAPDIIARDAHFLSKLTDGKLGKIFITGGEPLLHPELKEIVARIHNYFPLTPIQIMTNGILLAYRKEDFFGFLKNNNTSIWMTQYPIDFDYENLIQIIIENDCKLQLAVEEEKTSWRFPLDLSGRQEKFWMFFCWMHDGGCINLLDGKISPCGLMHASKHFEKYFGCTLKRSPRDMLDIYTVHSFDEISDFLADYQPFCSNCKICDWEIDIPWAISKKDIHEWA